jgi:hypothetical protein
MEDNVIMTNWLSVFTMLLIARSILKRRDNFVHNNAHACRIVLLLKDILGMQEFLRNFNVIILAAFWHDTGQSDAKDTSKWHHKISERLFIKYAKHYNIDEPTKTIVRKVILSHRNRGASSDFIPKTQLEKAFFDADKLDILNIKRTKRLLTLYDTGFCSGEFNKANSIKFWENFIETGYNKLFLEESKSMFKAKISKFNSLVQNNR